MQPLPYHLPGLQPDAFTDLTYGNEAEPVRLRAPTATPDLIAAAAARVAEARDAGLARMPTARIIAAIDTAIARWLDPAYPLRRAAEDLLPAVTGYSRPMVAYGLPQLLEPFRRDGLLALLRAELGDTAALDRQQEVSISPVPQILRFAQNNKKRGAQPGARPAGTSLQTPRLTTIVLAGNIPAVAVESMVHALLVRSACLVKASSRDPLFPALFAQSLAEADADVGKAVAVLWWKGGSEALDRAALAPAEAVIAYGGAQVVEALRRLVPAGAPFVAYGPRISFAAVAREALGRAALDDLASRAAYDVSLFDQQGCVAPHAIFVERGGEASPRDFARALAEAMDAFERRLPRGRIAPPEAARIHQMRGAWAMRRAAGQDVALFHSEGSTAWTVAYDAEARHLTPSCLNRVVTVIPLDDLAQVPDGVRPLAPHLQTAALSVSPSPPKAGEESKVQTSESPPHIAPGGPGVWVEGPVLHGRLSDLVATLARLGVTRFCRIGRAQHPPAQWPHDGQPNLLPLLR